MAHDHQPGPDRRPQPSAQGFPGKGLQPPRLYGVAYSVQREGRANRSNLARPKACSSCAPPVAERGPSSPRWRPPAIRAALGGSAGGRSPREKAERLFTRETRARGAESSPRRRRAGIAAPRPRPHARPLASTAGRGLACLVYYPFVAEERTGGVLGRSRMRSLGRAVGAQRVRRQRDNDLVPRGPCRARASCVRGEEMGLRRSASWARAWLEAVDCQEKARSKAGVVRTAHCGEYTAGDDALQDYISRTMQQDYAAGLCSRTMQQDYAAGIYQQDYNNKTISARLYQQDYAAGIYQQDYNSKTISARLYQQDYIQPDYTTHIRTIHSSPALRRPPNHPHPMHSHGHTRCQPLAPDHNTEQQSDPLAADPSPSPSPSPSPALVPVRWASRPAAIYGPSVRTADLLQRAAALLLWLTFPNGRPVPPGRESRRSGALLALRSARLSARARRRDDVAAKQAVPELRLAICITSRQAHIQLGSRTARPAQTCDDQVDAGPHHASASASASALLLTLSTSWLLSTMGDTVY
ncbi:hypothetical protein JHW43_008515 [Diplocarpon mali]|nr:hypothetical protein JHW43_008515 [Diplocarpon mali]